MRFLGLGLVCLSGCGLLLDLDPPDMDGGPRVDSGQLDVAFVDGAEPDVDDAGFDSRPPLDGGSCISPAECEAREPGCGNRCIGITCVRDDMDDDGICDLLDCQEGKIEYLATTCGGSRALQICVDSVWEEHVFDEIESCDEMDQDCSGTADEGLAVQCGIGACALTRRLCGESCLVSSTAMTSDGCTPVGVPVDEDCDGQVDEDCNIGIDCVAFGPSDGTPEPNFITAAGDYCLDVGECSDDNVNFAITVVGPLDDVHIHGDMHMTPAGSFVPCAPTSPAASPRSTVFLSSGLVVGGQVQVTNARLQQVVGALTPTVTVQRDGMFRGHHIEIEGGPSTALVVRADGSAYLSDVHVSSRSTEHTIDSEGRLVVEASCGGRVDGRGRCNQSDGTIPLGGITKATAGGSVIQLTGDQASLEMTATRVWGRGSTAILANDVVSVEIFDSVVVASADEVMLLDGCTEGGIVRDSFVINQGGDMVTMKHAVRAQRCAMHFTAPNRPLSGGGFHIVGSTRTNGDATGVRCGEDCRFEDISVAGFASRLSTGVGGIGIGAICQEGCVVAHSTIVGNASDVRGENATGLQIAGGDILRSRVGGGNATNATGLQAQVGTPITFQDSLAIGFVGAPGAAVETFSGRGVGVENGSSFSALHSTIAARSVTRGVSPARSCHALEAADGAEVALVSSLLWAPCEGGFSYYGNDVDDLVLADRVGVAEGGSSYVGGAIPNADVGYFLLVPDATEFGEEYSGVISPTGSVEMRTETDLNGVPRPMMPPIGAYAN